METKDKINALPDGAVKTGSQTLSVADSASVPLNFFNDPAWIKKSSPSLNPKTMFFPAYTLSRGGRKYSSI